MNKFLELPEEKNGKLSYIRIASFLIAGTFVIDWILHIIRNAEFNPA